MDASVVTLTLPVAMALVATAVSVGIGGVLWIVSEIRSAVAPVAKRAQNHEIRITRLETRAEHARR